MVIQNKGGVAPGDIDVSFGQDGKALLNFPEKKFQHVFGLASGPNGTILAAGSTQSADFIIGCLNENGSPELSFGNNGAMTGRFLGYQSVGRSVIALDDGKVLVTGIYVASDQVLPAISRLLPNGDFDTTFGNGGTFAFPPTNSVDASTDATALNESRSGASTQTHSVLLPDGKILISHPLLADSHGLLIRLTADGIPDGSFNNTGFTTVRYPDADTFATTLYSLIVTSEGKIVLCGVADLTKTEKRVYCLLARYDSNGRPDTSFGSEGSGFIALEVPGHIAELDALVAGEDGRLVAFGGMANFQGKAAGITLGRMADGSPDPGYNNGEINHIDLPTPSEWYSAARMPGGSALVAGITYDSSRRILGILVAKYLNNGQLDKNFGRGEGWVSLEPAQQPQLILQDEGKILICGRFYDEVERYCAVLRVVN